MKEVEALFPLKQDIETALEKVAESGRYTGPKVSEVTDTFYFSPEEAVTAESKLASIQQRCCRLREKTAGILLTVKDDVRDESGNWLYSNEYEVSVKDVSTAENMIKFFGWVKGFSLKMRKHVFVGQDEELVLEEVEQIGNFVECESKHLHETDGQVMETRLGFQKLLQSMGLEFGEELSMGKPELFIRSSAEHDPKHS